MDTRAFDGWLRAYGRAWEARDPEAAADLFTEDASYYETPFDPPATGRSAILNYWSAVPRYQRDISFRYQILAVTEDQGIARWWASFTRVENGRRVELDGVFLVTMDESDRCATFREWWHRREDVPE